MQILRLIRYTFERHWEARNRALHGDDDTTTADKVRGKLKKALARYYEFKPLVSAALRNWLFSSSLEEMYELRPNQQRAWLAHAHTVLQRKDLNPPPLLLP